jgi:transposase InsO family protein
MEGRGRLIIPFCKETHLPMGYTKKNSSNRENLNVYAASESTKKRKDPNPMGKFQGSGSLTEGVNFNLAEPEKELLKWHYRLGHIGMRRVQWLFRQGALSTSERTRRLQQAAAKLDCGPLCTACQYSKQRRKTSPGSTKRTDTNLAGALKIDKMFPGQQVSVDHFYSSSKGRLLNTYGKESDDQKYVGGCIFVDHSSGLIHVELQSHLNSHETLGAKKEFETMSSKYGVVIQEYLSDNGTAFRNQDFLKHLEQFHQTMKHSAVGAHHSNGIAERNIGYVLSISRAMLHHAALHWPDIADVELWPLAVLHAVHVLNRIPRTDTGLSPIELFTRKTWPRTKLQDLHVWGCPAYVLDGTLSDGKKIPRWKPRSDRSIYVGHSPLHSSAIPIVLNLSSGNISPQYHVIFDDWFQTVSATDEDQINFEHDDWYKTFGLTEWQYVQDNDDDMLPPVSMPGYGGVPTREGVQGTQLGPAPPQPSLIGEHEPPVTTLPPTEQLPHPEPEAPHPEDPVPEQVQTPTPMAPIPVETPLPIEHPASPQREKMEYKTDEMESVPTPPSPDKVTITERPNTRSQALPRRSLRTPKPKVFGLLEPDIAYWSSFIELYGTPQPTVSKVKARKDPDLFNWDEAMASDYKQEFLESAQAEIAALAAEGTWIEDLRTNATTRIVPNQWVFRIKRSPDGEVRKFKGRIVIRGDLQNYEGETYSPVASWSTVRLAVVMCLKLNWKLICIDFSSAFVQSPLPEDDPVWMHSPRGFACSKGASHVLRLKKSLYGMCQSPVLWFKFISKAFKELGLTQSEHDACLWYGKDLILVQYVDDCGIGAPSMKIIDEFVSNLKKKGLKLTQEGSFTEFLGIKFERNKDESFKLTQKGLITKILEATSMTDCNPNSLPAARNALGADKEGETYHESWNYRAIVGMLLYLSTNSRPDISFAVSQVARFSSDPKKSHATALKTIIRYLKKTIDQGMIIHPTRKFIMDLYVDADFCGLFKQEDDRDPNVARSRMGYIILFCGCPLIWKTSLMQHITQSTTEAEYSALTSALRVFLPLKLIVEELILKTSSIDLEGATVHATVFEDNQSALYLATNQRITNRTKYFLAKWHWFWTAYNEKQFRILKCPTELMRADYFTKSLAKEPFERNRLAVQGW